MTDAHLLTAIGAISGTSMDGIDVALVKTDGRFVVEPGPAQTISYPAPLRQELFALLADPSRAEHHPLEELDHAVTMAFAHAITLFMQQHGVAASDVDVVGLHGQTVYHRPERRFTRQL